MAYSFCWLQNSVADLNFMSQATAESGQSTACHAVNLPRCCLAWPMETVTTWLSERGVALTTRLSSPVRSCGFRRTLSLGRTFSCLTTLYGHFPLYGGTASSSRV